MSTLPKSLLSNDFNHLISCRKSTLTGVSPTSIQGLTFDGEVSTITLGSEVEINGVMKEASVSIRINSQNYSTMPSLGSVLLGAGGRYYKVIEIVHDDIENPVGTTLNCIDRHQQ